MTTSMKSIWANCQIIITAILVASLVVCPGVVWAIDINTLPGGGYITAGSGTISTSGSNMTITQSSNKMVANWDSFNIGKNAVVTFVQPSAQSAALNRIADINPSQILGQLNANGQIFLLNPSGVIFGQTARVDVGGLVASSLDLTDNDFLNGNYDFSGGAADIAEILNQGDITTTNGGTVAFIAPQVVNDGTIATPGGSSALIAATKVTLDFNGDGLINYSVDRGAVDALAANHGLIKADGGLVVMTAKSADTLSQAVVNNDGVIEAHTLANRNGRIMLLADMANGEAIVGGTLDASAPAGGDGGFIETSGATIGFGEDLLITAAAPMGRGGEWMIDPYNYTIDTTAADNITTALNSGTDVTVTTASDNTDYGSDGYGVGDILVNSSINKTAGGDATFTLLAANTIVINEAITSSAGKLNMVFDADNDSGYGDGAGIVLLNADISTNGGNLSFGAGRRAIVNGVDTLVGGDVYVAGSGVRSLTTNGGDIDICGEMIIANTNGLTIDSADGSVHFYGLLNSGNSYEKIYYYANWDDALADAKSGDGSNIGDTYLATITSRLENAVASRVADYDSAVLGAQRVVGIGTDNLWRWVTGPEGLQDDGNGLAFFVQNGSETENGSGGTAIDGSYSNWNYLEPNNYQAENLTIENESIIEFIGMQGQWNDMPRTSNPHSYYVKETNLAASPLTINAGSGTVSFDGAVGGSKALASLAVTSTGGIAINGGEVTTEGLQTYDGNINLGAANTILTQTAANTDFTLMAGKSIANTSSDDRGLTIKTTRSIIMESGSSIVSATGTLDTVLWARADGNNDASDDNMGTVWLPVDSLIRTGGGDVTIGGGADPTVGYALGDTTSTSSENNARYRGVTVNGTIDADGGNISIHGRGALTASNARGVSIGGAISTTGSGTIAVSGIAEGGSDGLALGDNYFDPDADGTLSTVDGDITLEGIRDSGAGINLSTTGSGVATTGTGSLAMTSTGNINGVGSVVVGGTTSITADTYDVILNNTANNFGDAVSVASAGNLSLIDRDAMILGNISTNGTVDVATLTGNLTIGGAISTADATEDAIKLNAAKDMEAGTSTGGNILVGGSGAVSVGSGGRATLYSGSVSDSTGLTSLVGSGTGNFRYNSDESSSDFTTALGSGTYAIYREQPILTVTANDDSKTYDTSAYTGGNGVVSAGFVNGDTDSIFTGSLTYSGTSQSATDAGSYAITPGGYSNGLGYNINFVDGVLTIQQKVLNISGLTAANKVYDGTVSATASGTETLTAGAVTDGDGFYYTGDDLGLTGSKSFAFSDKNVANNKNVTVAGLSLTGTDAANYTLNNVVATADITAKPLTLTGFTANDKVYDRSVTATIGNAGGLTGVISGDTVTVSNSGATFADWNVGVAKTVTLNGISLSGSDSGNYSIAATATTTADITPKPLGLDLGGKGSKVYDGTNSITLDGVSYSLLGVYADDDVTLGTGNVTGFADKNAGTNKEVVFTGFIIDGNDVGNYSLTSGSAISTADILKADATVTANSDSVTYNGTTQSVTGFSASGLVNGETTSVLDGVSTSGGSGINAGVYAHTASGSDDNYNLTFVDGSLTITPASLTIKANDDSKVFDALPYFGGNGVTYSGFVGEEFASVLDGKLVYGGTSQGAIDAGSYVIAPSGLSSGNYTISYINGSLVITKNNDLTPIVASVVTTPVAVNGTQQQVFEDSVELPSMGPGTGADLSRARGQEPLIIDRTGYVSDGELRM